MTTGATGDVHNVVNSTTLAGTPGMPGRETSATVPHYDPPTMPLDIHSTDHSESTVNDALDHAQTHLTDARARVESALSNVPAEYQAQVRAQVDAAFTRGSDTISNARKRRT